MPLEQRGRVLRHQRVLLLRERAAAGVQDERVVGDDVAPARRARRACTGRSPRRSPRRTPGRSRRSRRAARGARTCRSPRRSAGRDRSAPRPRRTRARPARDRRRRATRCSRRSAGTSRISALFENGVIVPIDGSVAAQRRSASSQPSVTIVSLLSSTTSRRDSPMPRLAVPVKPRLRVVARAARRVGCCAAAISSNTVANAGIGRRVVDQHQAVAGRRVREHAGDAARARRPARCRPARRRRPRSRADRAHASVSRFHASLIRIHGRPQPPADDCRYAMMRSCAVDRAVEAAAFVLELGDAPARRRIGLARPRARRSSSAMRRCATASSSRSSRARRARDELLAERDRRVARGDRLVALDDELLAERAQLLEVPHVRVRRREQRVALGDERFALDRQRLERLGARVDDAQLRVALLDDALALGEQRVARRRPAPSR